MRLKIKPAQPGEAPALTALIRSSKKHWGYSDTLLKQWDDDLIIRAHEIEKELTFKAVQGNELVGLYALWETEDRERLALEHFWLDPSFIGTGFGRTLFEHMKKTAVSSGASTIHIVSDPNAEGFYLKMGACKVGERQSPVSGRMLPALELSL